MKKISEEERKTRKKEYGKAYRKANREEILAKKKKYYQANREHILAQKKERVEANKESIRDYQKAYLTKLRNEVIALYSRGTNKCSCGALVQHLHHTDPAMGFEDRELYGRGGTTLLLHYLDVYTLIPDYITPVCEACHLRIHRDLKKTKEAVV